MRTPVTEPSGPRATLALGGALGCLGCALLLLGFAARAVLVSPDCAGRGASDCALLREVARELAFRQALVSLALLILAIPLGRWARGRQGS